MIGEGGCETLLQRALSMSKAEDTEVFLAVQDLGLTRFANSSIHQNVFHSNAQLHVRTVVGGRQGRATTNDLSDQGLAEVVGLALRHTLLMPGDPDFRGLPSPAAPPKLATYDESTAGCGPESRADIVGSVCRQAAASNLGAFGAYRTGVQEMAVMSTRGARGHHVGTFAGLIITTMSDTSAGWAKGSGWRASDIDVGTLAEEAIGKAVRGRDPRAIEPGEYTVVLDPYAADDILGSLSLYGAGARAVQDGQSWMNGIIGTRAMSPRVSIWDDGSDLRGWPTPFDAEGVPRERVDIVRDGMVREPVHSSYTAAREGGRSTGHQDSPTGGPMATNLFMKGGDDTLEGMIGSTRRGLYITRFFYTRLVHNKGCVMTGMTRDGVHIIERGELAYPVKNLRFTQAYVDALAGVEAASSDTKLILNEVGFATRVPALKLRSFNFTGVTV